MSSRASITFGVLSFLCVAVGTAHAQGNAGFASGSQRPPASSAAPAAGRYGGVPAYRGYPTTAGRPPYGGYYAGNRGVPGGAYRGGGRWYGGWGPRAYYGPGLPWFVAAAPGYAPYGYGAPPYFYANPAYYAWNPGYGAYVMPPPAPVAAVAPPAPSPAPPAQELVLKGVDFETASAELRPESTAILDGVAETVRRCNCAGVEIRGYTDSVGDRDYNQNLSEQRANAVKEYLERHGVTTGILTAHGFGEDNPIATNANVEGRAENRRVTVQFSAPAGAQHQY